MIPSPYARVIDDQFVVRQSRRAGALELDPKMGTRLASVAAELEVTLDSVADLRRLVFAHARALSQKGRSVPDFLVEDVVRYYAGTLETG